MSGLTYLEALQADVFDPEVQAEERAIYLEHRVEYSGVHEYQAEGTGQAATSNNHASLAWQLRNLKARVTNLEGTSSNYLRNQVDATVQDQQGLQSHLQRLQVDQQRLQTDQQSLQGRSSISIQLAPTDTSQQQ